MSHAPVGWDQCHAGRARSSWDQAARQIAPGTRTVGMWLCGAEDASKAAAERKAPSRSTHTRRPSECVPCLYMCVNVYRYLYESMCVSWWVFVGYFSQTFGQCTQHWTNTSLVCMCACVRASTHCDTSSPVRRYMCPRQNHPLVITHSNITRVVFFPSTHGPRGPGSNCLRRTAPMRAADSAPRAGRAGQTQRATMTRAAQRPPAARLPAPSRPSSAAPPSRRQQHLQPNGTIGGEGHRSQLQASEAWLSMRTLTHPHPLRLTPPIPGALSPCSDSRTSRGPQSSSPASERTRGCGGRVNRSQRRCDDGDARAKPLLHGRGQQPRQRARRRCIRHGLQRPDPNRRRGDSDAHTPRILARLRPARRCGHTGAAVHARWPAGRCSKHENPAGGGVGLVQSRWDGCYSRAGGHGRMKLADHGRIHLARHGRLGGRRGSGGDGLPVRARWGCRCWACSVLSARDDGARGASASASLHIRCAHHHTQAVVDPRFNGAAQVIAGMVGPVLHSARGVVRRLRQRGGARRDKVHDVMSACLVRRQLGQHEPPYLFLPTSVW